MSEFTFGSVRIWRRELLGVLVAAVLITLIACSVSPSPRPMARGSGRSRSRGSTRRTRRSGSSDLLFSLMGVAVSLVYRRGTERRVVAVVLNYSLRRLN